jgi:hypothetical protein
MCGSMVLVVVDDVVDDVVDAVEVTGDVDNLGL